MKFCPKNVLRNYFYKYCFSIKPLTCLYYSHSFQLKKYDLMGEETNYKKLEKAHQLLQRIVNVTFLSI